MLLGIYILKNKSNLVKNNVQIKEKLFLTFTR